MKTGALPSRARLALLSLLLGLGLLTPGTSLAAWGNASLLASGRDAPLRGMVNGTEGAGSGGLPRLLRVPAELGLGALGGLGLGVSGALIGALLTTPDTDSPFRMYLGGALGLGLGVTLGVWGAGTLAGGDGSLLATTGGMAVGMALGAGLASLFPLAPTQMLYLLPLPLLGAVVGYELSNHLRGAAPASSGGLGGAVFTVGGRF
jgi:hypothetical protein